MGQHKHEGCGHVRVEAPEGTDPLLIAQAVVGHGWLIKAERVREAEVSPHAAMNESVERFMAFAHEKWSAMLRAITQKLDTLTKGPKPLITTKQLHEIAQIIRDHHTALVIGGVGTDAVTPDEVKRMVALGLMPKSALTIIDDAYTYGALIAEVRAMRDPKYAAKFSFDAFKRRLAKRPVPLTPTEQEAVDFAKHSAATYIKGLGNRVADDFTTTAIEADRKLRARYESIIREEVSENVARSEGWREIASSIGHRTKDWARDLKRIAATEKQRAMQEGFTKRLIKREGGDPRQILVAKIPTPDACEKCVQLHLTGGRGSKPRIFRLSDLIANGSNVGKQQGAWRATVGPVHPWCACELVHVPEGWGFDEGGNLVPRPLRKGWRFGHDLAKALSYADGVPESGIVVRVGDPEIVAVIDEVISRTPPMLFNKRTGVTLITTDHPNANSHLNDHDLAYWTGNEIRLRNTLSAAKTKSVLEHEIGHALNVYLVHQMGSQKAVEDWHTKLNNISKQEGYVSDYAKTLPIENAAEVSRLYLYERPMLQRRYPRQFAFVHRAYRDLFGAKALDVLGISDESDIDTLTFDEFYERFERAANRHGFARDGVSNGARIYTLGNEGKVLAILSGLHGEERAGPIAMMRWLETTPVGHLVPPGVRLWILPLFSQAAWNTHKRAPGDVNRNDIWGPGAKNRTPAVREVEQSLRAAKPFIFLDLHEDSTEEKGRSYIFGYHRDEEFAPKLARFLGCKVEKWRYRDASSRGASETFVRMIGCERTSTVETPQTLALADRVEFHQRAVQWCVHTISEAP